VWFVIALIAVPFAFWGIQSFRSGGADPVVVKVGDQKITQAQFRQTYDQRYQQYRSLLGESFRADLFDENRFRELTLDDMVQESAMRQYARSAGYRASDATLRDFLMTVPSFQKEGKFSSETYRALLQEQGMKPDAYERQLRESLAIEQLRNAVQSTSFITAEQAWAAHRLEKQVRKITVVPVSAKGFREKVKVTDDQVADRYETEKSRFLTAERIKLAYIELDRKQLATAEAPAPEVLKALYEAEKDARFASPEERRASHILITFGADKAAAKKKAEDLLAKIKGGQDFAQVASEVSEDTDSKPKGGDLGWVRKGMMAPKFEEALYAIPTGGEVVGPVETEFGWHLIKLVEIKPASIRPFEDEAVQAELLEAYSTREGEKRFQELSSKLESLAFENTTLEPVATEMKLEIKKTDWLTRDKGGGDSGIAAVEAVKQAAFSPEVIRDGENSKPIPASADALVVIHKAEHEPSRQRPLDEVKEQIRETLTTEGAAKLAREAAEALVAKVKAGQSLRDAAAAQGLTLQFDGDALRGQAQLEGAVADAAFRMPRPAQGAAHVEAIDTGNGGTSVVSLNEVVDPPRPDDATLRSDGALQGRVRDSLAGAEFGAYRKSVEDEIKVERVQAPEVKSDNPEL
jgi:peptidyl-prolyl cis-trans isomerase D